MFNTLFEHFSVCQALLKEQKQSTIGGLLEAFKESLGRGVSTPSSLRVRLKMTSEASVIQFPPA